MVKEIMEKTKSHTLSPGRLAGLAVLLFTASPALGQMPGSLPMCPSMGPDMAMRCLCWASATAANAPVWGSGIYASESSVCAAARHAGVIGPEGGPVRVIPLPGQPSYRGSYHNGVRSADRGSAPRSFRVEGANVQSWGVNPRAP